MRQLFEETKPFLAGMAVLVFAVLITGVLIYLMYLSFEIIGGISL